MSTGTPLGDANRQNRPGAGQESNPVSYRVVIRSEMPQMQLFSGLFSKGVEIRVRTPSSLRDLLCRQLNLSSDYVAQRLQTIFLDYRAVDDLDCAQIRKGSILALSAAMPGLVGATFRRRGFYSSMRSGISCQENRKTEPDQECRITLKLFNFVAREKGPAILSRGVVVPGEDFEALVLARISDRFPDGFLFSVDGERLDEASLAQLTWQDQTVFLRVLAGEG